jgi:diguanylate cyclase
MELLMRYSETPTQSAELLRLILPHIARSGGNYAPPAYTIWYEHLSGVNPTLSGALESALAKHESLATPVIEDLYAQHIQEREVRNNEQLQAGLNELLRKLVLIATTSGEGTAVFEQQLATCEQELGSITNQEGLQRILKALVQSTATARTSTQSLQSELETAQSEMKSLRDRLGTLQGESLTDPLSGLRNRRGFEEAVARLGTEGPGLEGAAILLADLDKFKSVNDTYGHLFGDQVIRAASKVLSDAIKGRDVVARYGGEEFVMLLPETPAQGAMALAEQIRLAFSRVRVQRSGSDKVLDNLSISIGVAMPGPGETVDQVIDRADKALYQAKRDGRNCVRMSVPGKGQHLKLA